MEIPEFFKKAIDDIGGKNLHGEPKYRVVWSKDQRWEHGILKGDPKYLWPDGREMECFILEVWYPPHYFGDPAEWNEAVCGEFPYHGFYGIKTPLATIQPDGSFFVMPLNESTLDAIRQKHLHDLEWHEADAIVRYNAILDKQVEWNRNRVKLAEKEADELFDHYHAHCDDLDNADNRVWSMPKHLDVIGKGLKMPVEH